MEPIPVVYYEEENYDETVVKPTDASLPIYQTNTSLPIYQANVSTATGMKSPFTTTAYDPSNESLSSWVDLLPSTSSTFSTPFAREENVDTAIPVTQEGGNQAAKGMY